MNFKYIRNFFDTDERFSYMHDLLENKMDVHIANGQSFIIIQEKYSLFKAIYALPDNPFLKVSFNISDEESFRDAIETIYKSATASDNQPKEAVEYPRGGNTMYKQTVNKSFDFLNDYKVVKLAERAINDNFAELANDFIKYSNSEKDSGTILSCGNSKVLFSSTKFNRKITIEFGRDGEEPFRYVYTNNGINLLNDYDPAALITIGNLIESAVESWLENDKNRMNIEDLNERLLSVVDNIKTMIGLINTTIGKYNA